MGKPVFKLRKRCIFTKCKEGRIEVSLGDEQYKRLMAYMKALQKLEQMENMVEE